jgi:hypothetical protein
MALPTGNLTRIPGGLAQFTIHAVGGAAGDITVTGMKATDEILYVEALAFDTDGDAASVTDITARCTPGTDKIVLGAGDSMADNMLAITFVRPVA